MNARVASVGSVAGLAGRPNEWAVVSPNLSCLGWAAPATAAAVCVASGDGLASPHLVSRVPSGLQRVYIASLDLRHRQAREAHPMVKNWGALLARVRAMLLRRGRSSEDADDLVQDRKSVV